MGEKEDFALAVLDAYVKQINFEGLHIDLALRKYIQDFRLPGESQKIDRMMDKFSSVYWTQNPAAGFKSASATFILAFATIMLATDLHSPNTKQKMTLPGFKSMVLLCF